MQRTGIIPDIEVYPTMDDIMAGRDEVLEAAIKFLNADWINMKNTDLFL